MPLETITIAPKAPYNFDLQWRFYSSEEPQPETYKEGVWRRAFKMGDKIIPLAISSIGGTHEKTMLEVDVFSKIDAKEKTYLLKEITDIFRLKDDLGGLYNFMDRVQ